MAENHKNNFDKVASTWDQNEIRLKMAQTNATLIRQTLKLSYISNVSVLDFGCGTGLLGLEFTDAKNLFFTDNSEGMLKEVSRKIKDLGLKNRAEIFKWPDEIETLAKLQADLIVSQMVLHHIENLEELAHQLFKITAPKGLLALIDLDPEDGSFHGESHTGRLGINRKELEKDLANAGFADIKFFEADPILKNNQSYTRFLCTAIKPTQNKK